MCTSLTSNVQSALRIRRASLRRLPLISLRPFRNINDSILCPNVHSTLHHLLIQPHQTPTLDIDSGRGTRFLPRRRHKITETVKDSRTAVFAEYAFHLSTRKRVAGVCSHEVGDGFRELKVREDSGDAVGGGTLVLAFCAVAGV
jgi:hypothetical protein